MSQLQIKANHSALTNVNVRKQGSGDGEKVAMDLKFNCLCSASVAMVMLGQQEIPNFWAEGGDQDPLYWNIGAIPIIGEFQEQELSFQSLQLSGGTVKKCAFLPRQHQLIDLTFTYSIVDPSDEVIALAPHYIKIKGVLEVTGQADLFASEPEGDEVTEVQAEAEFEEAGEPE